MTRNICIPNDKSDVAAVERAARIGYPGINACLPALLEWYKDRNWPVAEPLAPLLAAAVPQLAPHLIEILSSHDYGWTWAILTGFTEDISPDVQALVRPAVERLATRPTSRERHEALDEAAQDLLESWSVSRT